MRLGREPRRYAHLGRAGCVITRRAHATGFYVSIYHGRQAGLDSDPSNPWVVVCEEHSLSLVCPTLESARSNAVVTFDWCEGCYTARRRGPQPANV